MEPRTSLSGGDTNAIQTLLQEPKREAKEKEDKHKKLPDEKKSVLEIMDEEKFLRILNGLLTEQPQDVFVKNLTSLLQHLNLHSDNFVTQCQETSALFGDGRYEFMSEKKNQIISASAKLSLLAEGCSVLPIKDEIFAKLKKIDESLLSLSFKGIKSRPPKIITGADKSLRFADAKYNNSNSLDQDYDFIPDAPAVRSAIDPDKFFNSGQGNLNAASRNAGDSKEHAAPWRIMADHVRSQLASSSNASNTDTSAMTEEEQFEYAIKLSMNG